MKLLSGLLFVVCLCAQTPANPPVLTVSTVGTVPASVYPGQVLNLQISLTGSAGWNVSAFGFTSWAAVQNMAAGAASTAAQKTLWAGSAGSLLAGFTAGSTTTAQDASDVAYADGQVLTLSYTVPTNQAIGSTLGIAIPSPVFASDINGASVTITIGSPLSIPVAVNPVCVKTANSDIQNFLSIPSQSLENTLVAYLNTIIAGTCH